MPKVEIGGTDVSTYVDALSVDLTGNERATASLVLEGDAGVPEEDEEAEIYGPDGTTVLFGGFVRNTKVRGWTDTTDAFFVDVDLDGWERVCEWCSISLSYTSSVALEDVWEDIVTEKLSDYGITYSKVATGVTIKPFTVSDIPVINLVRDLRTQTNQLIKFQPDKSTVIQAWGGTAATLDLTSANRWKFERVDRGLQPRQKANRVKGLFGPNGTYLTSQEWIANGTDTSWVTEIPATGIPPLVLVDDSVHPFLAPVGPGGWFEWSLTDNAPYGTLKIGTYGTPANGVRLKLGPSLAAGDPFETIGYMGVYPFPVEKGTGTPPREFRFRNESIMQFGPAEDFAEQVLSSLSRESTRTISATTTYDSSWDVGQAWTVNLPVRDLPSSTYLIQSVGITHTRGNVWRFDLEATEGSEPQETVNAELRALFGGAGGGSALSVLEPASGAGGAAGPNKSVQSNQNGVLYGDEDFTWDPVNKNFIAGRDCTIAAGAEACDAGGVDCHIGGAW